MQKFVQFRATGEVYYHTEHLERLGGVDVIEGLDDDTPDTVLERQMAIRDQLVAGNDAAIAERDEKIATLEALVAELQAKLSKKADKAVVVPPGVTIEKAE